MSDSDLEEKEAAGSHDGLGVHPERAEAEAAELDKLFENSSDDSDPDGGLYKSSEDKDKPRRGFLKTTKQRTTAGVLTVVIAGGGIFGVMQAPNMIVNHLRELLLTRISELQNHQTRKFRRSKLTKVGDMFTSDGRRGGRIIADMEARGYRFAYSGKRIVGLTPPGANTSIIGAGIADHLDDYMEIRHPLRTSKWKTKRMDAFYNRYQVSRRAVVVPSPDDPDDPRRAVNANLADDIAGDDLGTDVRGRLESDDTDADAERQANETLNADAETVAGGDGSLDDIQRQLREGVPIEELTPDEQALLRLGSTVDDDVLRVANAAAAGSVGSRVFGGIKGFFSSADIFDKVCTLKNRLAAVQIAARNYRALSMLRYASSFIKVADKTRAGPVSPGDIDPKMMNALMGRVTAVDSNGNSIGASPGFAYILKGKFSKSRNDTFKGSFGVDGKLSGTPAALQSATNSVPGMTSRNCGVIQNPVAQVGLVVVELGLGFLTGGASTATLNTGKAALIQAFKTSMRSVFTRQVARSVGRALAVELTFEGALMFTQLYAERSTAIPFTGQEKGGELGDILAGGGGSLNKQRSLQSGFVPATPAQYSGALAALNEHKQQLRKEQSLYARLFDYSNTDSLAFQTMSAISTAPLSVDGAQQLASTGIANMFNASIKGPSMLMMGIFGSRAQAQTADEVSFETYTTIGSNSGQELATDPAGNPLMIMRDDIASIDSETNLANLIASGDIDSTEPYLPKSDRFKEHVINCVEAMDILTTIEEGTQSNPEQDCMATQDITKSFKAHLAYIDMLDTLDASLFPEEIVSSSSGSSGSAVIPPDGLAWPHIENKASARANLGGCLNEASQSICHAGHPYKAHDLFAPQGTQVVAVAPGEVIKASAGTCGHGFGSAYAVQVFDSATNITYFYQHMDAAVGGVAVGTTLKAGDPIGKVGSTTAACNTSPHLHIDATSGRGRPPCSRLSCTAENKARFIDISGSLYKGYDVLP